MDSLSREFGSHPRLATRILERYEQDGLEGLSERTRGPFRYAIQLPEQLELAILRAKGEKPPWGAHAISGSACCAPAAPPSRCPRRYDSRCARSSLPGPAYRQAYCNPLTVTDYCSRYLLLRSDAQPGRAR